MRGKEYIISSGIATESAVIEQVREIAALEGVESVALPPIYVDLAAIAIGASKPEIVASLSRGTYPEVSALECAMAMENGADEIEVSLAVASLASGGRERAEAEIEAIKDETSGEAKISISIYGSCDDKQLVKEAVEVAISLEVNSIKISSCDSQCANIVVEALVASGFATTVKSPSFDDATISLADRGNITLIDIIYKN